MPAVPEASTNYGQPWQYTTLRDIFGQFRAEYDIAANALIYAAFGARDGSARGFSQTIRLTDAETRTAKPQGSYTPPTDNKKAATPGPRATLVSNLWTPQNKLLGTT